jgi:hypothetical protein
MKDCDVPSLTLAQLQAMRIARKGVSGSSGLFAAVVSEVIVGGYRARTGTAVWLHACWRRALPQFAVVAHMYG